ncbi:MAG: hypothetical protein HY682_04830 [Chloroflexi bacterium]|nr:hypothetical protein [Chloroflexota bacterium]
MIPIDSLVHVDIDVLIRKANGEIRSTLGTDVAATDNIADPQWHTKTVTYRVPEYVIIDPTDYLEIDFFAHVTQNDTGELTIVDFRFDDNSLGLNDRTSISNVGFYRE